MNRTEILERASSLINGDRAEAYGSYERMARDVAAHWSLIIGHTVEPRHFGPMMIALKLVRTETDPAPDCEVDIAGYAALHAEHFKE